MELAHELLKLWVFWYASAAFFGAFWDAMLALGVRELYRKLRRKHD